MVHPTKWYMMDHKKDPASRPLEGQSDMRHLTKPRGKGYSLRLKTPEILIGKENPWTGRPFGREIKLGLKTRVHSEAVRQRDICLGQIRELEHAVRTKRKKGGLDLSHESALSFRDMRRETADKDGFDHVLTDLLDKEARAGNEVAAQRFAGILFSGHVGLGQAVDQYLEERREGNPFDFEPLAKTTTLDVLSTVKRLKAFLQIDEPTLNDVTPELAFQFRTNYLPLVIGLKPQTIAKHLTLLRGVWSWAITDKRYLRTSTGKPKANPWVFDEVGTRKRKRGVSAEDEARTAFSPEEVSKLLAGYSEWGSRQGDIMRLALATGCRADEIGALLLKYAETDGSGFNIPTGKTANAKRYIPVVGEAKVLLQKRIKLASDKQEDVGEGAQRLFPEWPLKPSNGKANSVSQWFSRYRRDVLGKESDGRLAFHSFRHTWRTVARRAGVSEDRIRELGGWSNKKDTADDYDHGLLKRQLTEVQQRIWEELEAQEYLKHFKS